MLGRILTGLILFAPAVAGASYDWNQARELFPGIRLKQMAVTRPRLLSINILRVDLESPLLRVHASSRAPAYEEGRAETVRQTTGDFVTRSRAAGLPLVVAVNASPWTPWDPWTSVLPGPQEANIKGLAIAEGAVLSSDTGAPFLAVSHDQRAKIFSKFSPRDASALVSVFPGFSMVLSEGMPQGPDNRRTGLAPRTGFGTSDNGRYLYLLTVDGRQEGFSLGCTPREVGEWLQYFGADTGLNMDGGGSTSMVRWNSRSGQVEYLNRPSDRILGARVPRAVAFNLGVSLSAPLPATGDASPAVGIKASPAPGAPSGNSR